VPLLASGLSGDASSFHWVADGAGRNTLCRTGLSISRRTKTRFIVKFERARSGHADATCKLARAYYDCRLIQESVANWNNTRLCASLQQQQQQQGHRQAMMTWASRQATWCGPRMGGS